MRNTFCGNLFYMLRQLCPTDHGFQSGNQTFQHHGRLSGTGHTSYDGQSAFRNIHLQRLYRMNPVCGQMNGSQRKQFLFFCTRSHLCLRLSGQKGSDHGRFIFHNLRNASLGDDIAAAISRFRPHLNDPVRFRQYFCIMVHQQYRISIGHQIMHDCIQSHNIGRMQTDGRFIQHIKYACSPVSHCSCQLHSLPLAGRQSGSRTIQRQIRQSQIHEPFRHRLEGFTDTFRHRAHLFRKGIGHACHPLYQIIQCHPACFIKTDATKSRCSGCF